MTNDIQEETLVLMPESHAFSLHGPFLVTSQHASDIGLVGWKGELWTQATADGASRLDKNTKRSVRKVSRQSRRLHSRGASSQSSIATSTTNSQWRRAFDPTAAAFYYYNQSLGVTQWEPPAEDYEDDATVQYYTGVRAASNATDQRSMERTQHDAAPGEDHMTADQMSCQPFVQSGDLCDDAAVDCAREHQAPPAPANEFFSPAKKGDLRPDVEKYWIARYSLFSRWSDGVYLNEKSLFSVTPEVLAKHHANILGRHDVVVDAFCGCGGNAIQLAMTCKKVIACDIDEEQLRMARWNAQLYGVADRIEFKHVDFFKAASSIEADAVFLSPPWGGPEYISCKAFQPHLQIPGFGWSIQDCMRFAMKCIRSSPHTVSNNEVGETASSKAPSEEERPNIAVFLPKTTSVTGLACCLFPGLEPMCLERNHLNGMLKGVTLYALVGGTH